MGAPESHLEGGNGRRDPGYNVQKVPDRQFTSWIVSGSTLPDFEQTWTMKHLENRWSPTWPRSRFRVPRPEEKERRKKDKSADSTDSKTDCRSWAWQCKSSSDWSYTFKSNGRKINTWGEKEYKRVDNSVCQATESKAPCWWFKSGSQEKKDTFRRRLTLSVSRWLWIPRLVDLVSRWSEILFGRHWPKIKQTNTKTNKQTKTRRRHLFHSHAKISRKRWQLWC